MGAELFRKYVTRSTIICYRSLLRHPFLLATILFLFSIYRFFPLFFSLLVSTSPVLVSTAVLLGTLLSYGQPIIPEIENEAESERVSERVSERDEVQELESKVEIRTEETNGGRIEVADKSFDEMPKVIEGSSCVEDDRAVDLVDHELLQIGESRYSLIQQADDEHIVLESDKLWEGSADPLNSNSGLLWKGVERNGNHEDDDEEEEDDDGEGDGDDDDDDDDGSDSGDSGSDLAESSSPDASMADIIPMLDELHPLLSEEHETRQPSHDDAGAGAVSEHSIVSSDTSSESNDDVGILSQENLQTGGDEDKELKLSDKEDDTRSAITWTEYDQKNLMNLGTSEMERNRRLENLIARRRARKTMRMQGEKNLIDLESADLPFNIPPISTTRNNPFDYDANDNIPGSAPSVMLQRRNPFDLPYDSSEEKPDLVGDTFQQEFAVFEPKEPVFRRFESFSVGPSRSERRESKLKPYFVPERSFASFQRQFSGLSDSKVSSVPDTESVSSDIENKDHIEEAAHEAEHVNEADGHVSDHVSHGRPYFVPEHVASDETNFSASVETNFSVFQRQLSKGSDSKVSSETDTDTDTESVSSVDDVETKDHIDLSVQPDLISVEDHELASEIIRHISEHVSLVRESFDDDAEITVGSATSQLESHSSESSLSSLDEVSEQIHSEKEGDDRAMEQVLDADYFLDRGSSIERTETGVTSLLVEESQPNEAIYDMSPRSVTRNLSSSSISHDLHKDESSQHTDGHDQSSSSVSPMKSNSTESTSETDDAQIQLPAVPINSEHVSGNDVSTSLANKPAEDAVSDLDASRELEQVQVSPSSSQAISHDGFHLEDVMSQPDEEALLGRNNNKLLVEDSDELQERDLEHEVTLPSYDTQVIEVVHEDTYVNHSPAHQEEISQPENELFLLDTSVNKPPEEHPEELQVQIATNDSDSLQIQEPDVAEVTDIETKAQEIPEYASDTHSFEGSIDDVNEIKEIDEDLLVELDAVGDFSVNTFNKMKDDPHASEDDLESKRIADEDSYNNELESDLNELNQQPHVREHDLENSHSGDEDSNIKDSGLPSGEIKQEYVTETKGSGDEDSDSKNLGTNLDETKQDPSVSDHDLPITIAGDEDSYSKDSGTTLDVMKQDPHDSDLNLETEHSEEMKQGPHDSAPDLETKHSGDMDSYSKDVGSALDEMKRGPHDSDHDFETKHLEEMNQDPHDSTQVLETKHSEDVDSYPKELGSTMDEMKQDPHDLDCDQETNHSEDEDSYSVKDLDTTFNEMKQGTHATDHHHHHHLETFYSVDDNFYSRHVESTSNVIKQDLQASDQDLETNPSSKTEIKMDAEEGALQRETSTSNPTSGANEEPQETESTTPLANPTSAEPVSISIDKE